MEIKAKQFKVAVQVRSTIEPNNFLNSSSDENYICIKHKQDFQKIHASYHFDHVFDEHTKQIDLYSKSIVPLLELFLKGHNATILAYGQTGSGKTFTMGTNLISTQAPGNSDSVGIIPRLIKDIFSKKINNSNINITISYLELYNNKMIDLLLKESNQNLKTKKKVPLLEIQNLNGVVNVKNLTETNVSDASAVIKIIENCSKCRIVATTAKNMESSRSHAIFTIHFQNKLTNEKNKFNLIDLAGSERPDNTDKIRNMEGICINQELSFLKLALIKLAKNEHVVFSGNDLLRLLEDTFSGTNFSLFIACINPSDSNYAETYGTLQYCESIKRLKNIPKPVQENSSSNNYSTFMKELIELRQFKASFNNTMKCDASTSPIKFKELGM